MRRIDELLFHLGGAQIWVLGEEDRHETRDMRTSHGRPIQSVSGVEASDPGAGDELAGGVDGDTGAKV